MYLTENCFRMRRFTKSVGEIGGFFMLRGYRCMQEYEKEILELNEQGKQGERYARYLDSAKSSTKI